MVFEIRFFFAKTALTEDDILKSLQSKEVTFNGMVIQKVLSDRGTNSLGDFEVNYVYDPPARKIVDE